MWVRNKAQLKVVGLFANGHQAQMAPVSDGMPHSASDILLGRTAKNAIRHQLHSFVDPWAHYV